MQGKSRDFLTSELVTEAAIAFIHIRARSLVFSDAVRYIPSASLNAFANS